MGHHEQRDHLHRSRRQILLRAQGARGAATSPSTTCSAMPTAASLRRSSTSAARMSRATTSTMSLWRACRCSSRAHKNSGSCFGACKAPFFVPRSLPRVKDRAGAAAASEAFGISGEALLVVSSVQRRMLSPRPCLVGPLPGHGCARMLVTHLGTQVQATGHLTSRPIDGLGFVDQCRVPRGDP